MNVKKNSLKISKLNNKFCFVGISLASSSQTESGIAVLDRNLNLLRVDKVFAINDLEPYIKNIAPADSLVICVDLPKNAASLTGKWRQEAKGVSFFKPRKVSETDYEWADRFSDRGSDLCKTLSSMEIDVYRYYCYFTKNILNLNPPYRSRTPVACKALQMNIQNYLKINYIPNNLIALSGLNAIIGAYTAWTIATSHEGKGYKFIGAHNDINIATPI